MLEIVAKLCDFLAMAEKTQSINLLPNKGEGLLDQFLGWALTIGRLLVVLTETLALSIFFYRFSLDMKISDLHDQIKNQSAIITQFKTTEENARNLQARLALAQKADASGSISPDTLSAIINLGRSKVTFRDIQVGSDGVKVAVQSPSGAALKNFVSDLKNYPGISSVNVDSVTNSTTNATIQLTISAKLKTLKL